MSFIPKNPLIIPEVESSPSTPLAGTRGLFAGKDGWHDINQDGVEKKILTDTDINNAITYYNDSGVVPSDNSLFTFVVDDTTKTASVGAKSTNISGTIVIPYKYIENGETYIVTVISQNAFANCLDIENVILPTTIEKIEYNAFYKCGITELIIPNGVTSIGMDVFDRCESLADITIPVTVVSIGNTAFMNCSKLSNVYYEGTSKQWNDVKIGTGNKCLQDATIHYEHVNVTKGYVDSEIAKVSSGGGSSAEDIQRINSFIYYGDANIVPSDASLFEFATDDNTMTATIIRPSDKEYVEVQGDLVVPYEYYDVVKDKVYKVTELELTLYSTSGSWFLPNTLKKISSLTDCGLKEIVIPDGVEEISSLAFSSNFELHTITLPNSIKSIGDYAFFDSPIEKVYFKGTKEQWDAIEIGDGNEYLKNATIHYEYTAEDTPKQAIRFTHDISIESDEEGLHLVKNGTKSLLYDSTGSICADSARWAGTSDVASSAEMDRNNNYIDETYATKAEIQAVNGLKYYGDADIVPSEDSLFDYFLNADEKSYSIRMGENPLPKSIVIPYEYNGLPVTSIGEYAFSECASITHVTIPNSVTIIGDFSFYVCNKIAHLTLPDSLTSIGEYAFADCHALTEISVPYGVTSIGNAAFMNCSSLKTIAIPDTVSFMGYGVFLQCASLGSLTIGEGITLIGEDTISGCDSLTDVYYKGTKEQWESISISVNNESLEEATIHYGTPSTLDEAVKEIASLRSVIDQIYAKSIVKTAIISLEAAYWEQVGNSRYCQSVVIKGVTANSKVDLQPTLEQLMTFYEKDITFVTENHEGYVMVYCIGQRPANDYEIQVTITEVER